MNDYERHNMTAMEYLTQTLERLLLLGFKKREILEVFDSLGDVEDWDSVDDL